MQISTDNLVWNAVCALHQQKLNNDLYIFLSLAPKNINTFYTEGFFIAHYACMNFLHGFDLHHTFKYFRQVRNIIYYP